MKKIIALLTLALIFTLPCYAQNTQRAKVSFGDSSLLPAIKNFSCANARTTKLDTVSGEKGYWVERDYTTHNGKKFHVVWVDGAGPVGWQPKKVPTTQQDGVWGNGATFKSIIISGFDANFEQHPQLGLSLAIRLPRSALTIESANSTERELLSFAETFLKNITK